MYVRIPSGKQRPLRVSRGKRSKRGFSSTGRPGKEGQASRCHQPQPAAPRPVGLRSHPGTGPGVGGASEAVAMDTSFKRAPKHTQISRGSPEKQNPLEMGVSITWRFIIRNSSRGYGGREVPTSAVCKLETQGSWGMSPSSSLRPKNQGHPCLRAGEDGRLSSSTKILILAFLGLLALFKPSADLRGLPRGEGDLPSWSTKSSACLFQKHPWTHPRIPFCQLSGCPLAQPS